MEGDARDQLQPQPWIVGKVGADPSSHHVFCVPDDFSGSKGVVFLLYLSNSHFLVGRWLGRRSLPAARSVVQILTRSVISSGPTQD